MREGVCDEGEGGVVRVRAKGGEGGVVRMRARGGEGGVVW